MPRPHLPRSGRPHHVFPAGSTGWAYFNCSMFMLWAVPFVPVDDLAREAVYVEPLWPKVVSRLTVRWARHRHEVQDEALSIELCREMIEIEEEGKRREAHAPYPDPFMEKVYARYYYQAALRKISLVLEQRNDISAHLCTRHAHAYLQSLNDSLFDATAEAIIARADALLKGVPVAVVEQQYGDYVV